MNASKRLSFTDRIDGAVEGRVVGHGGEGAPAAEESWTASEEPPGARRPHGDTEQPHRLLWGFVGTCFWWGLELSDR